jgi:hypothetical protein
MRARAGAALALGALVAAAGCAQVFGLGDYGPEPEDGGMSSDAT